MATAFTKLNGFVENLAEKRIDLASATLTIALSNTAPAAESTPPTGAAAECILANVTQVAYTYCSSRVLTVSSSVQTAGTYKLILDDLILTASGGAVGPFRYVYIYDDSATNNELIGYYDYAAALTLNDTDTLTLNFDGSAGVLTIV